jgi:hypothetical protein
VDGNIQFYGGFDLNNPKSTPIAYRYRLSDKNWFPQRILDSDEIEKRKQKSNPN